MKTTINTKLLEFQKRIGIIKKDSKNPHFKNTYASLTQILSEVKPLLTECGLILIQPISLEGVGTTIIDFETGEKIETVISLPTNLSPQQLGSAITYFRRYTLASLLSLEIDDDDAQSTVVKQPNLLEQVETAKAKIITATSLKDLELKYKSLTAIEQRFQDVIELVNKLKPTLKKLKT
jgi:phage-related protein